ncbi:MAG: hypothetical protein LBP82_03770 [Candidatus Methanoplasma sp.]|jgi:hypothetical protein|nr:hypothetical protein [Candidatus Methanoplasma sp.]
MAEKGGHSFEDFLSKVGADRKGFVTDIHDSLTDERYKAKIELKASGFFVSYSHPETKRSILNFFFRKKGLMVRIYADNHGGYKELLNGLPDSMVKEIGKAPVCKRLIDPNDCNPKCITGYDFCIRDEHYQKCRYGCFEFIVADENIRMLSDLIENERVLRRQN